MVKHIWFSLHLLYFLLTIVGNASILAGSEEYQRAIVDGKGTQVLFEHCYSIAQDEKTGDLYIAEADAIRKITKDGTFYFVLVFASSFNSNDNNQEL
jgi:hypothetical protein